MAFDYETTYKRSARVSSGNECFMLLFSFCIKHKEKVKTHHLFPEKAGWEEFP